MKKEKTGYGFISLLMISAAALFISCGTSSESTGGAGATASISLSASPTSIEADGASSATVTATVTDSVGSPVTAGTSISFSATLGTFPSGGSSYSATTPDSSGSVTVALIAGTTAGTSTVTASSNGVTQNTTVTFTESSASTGTPGSPASILLYSVQRESISVTGSGEADTSTITFVVKDVNGIDVDDGQTINFSIVGGGVGGGEALSASSDTTEGGYVSTTLQSGTRAGTVKVRAELASDSSVNTNVSITIEGGPPYGEHLGVNPETLNIAGLVYYGLEDTMTMRVTDKYFNNVPDGTSVYFTTDFGGITGSDTTESSDGESGSFASAILTSQVPDPSDGFVKPVTSTQSGAYARVLCIAIDPSDTDIIYLGTDGGGVFKTLDGGANWSQVGKPETGMTNGVVWDIEIDSENNAIIYAAVDDGVFRSTGSADEWEKLSRAKEITGETPSGNSGNLDVTDADNDGYSDQAYTLAYFSNQIRAKTHVYLDGIETYQYVYSSATTIRFIVKDIAANDGDPITIDYTTPTMVPVDYPIRALALRNNTTGDPANLRTLYAGTYGNGVYQSTDGGFSWSAKNNGLSDQDVLSLAIDPGTNSTVYAGTQGGGVFKSTDSAANWTASNSGLPASVVRAITVDPNTTSRIYIGTAQNGVYYSTNSGTTWTAPTTNVTSTQVNKIVLDSSANPATEIYAATYGDGTDPLGGVYKSSNSGASWARLTALGENHADALGIISGTTDTLLAGTWGRNLYESTNGGVTWTATNGSSPDELTNNIFATTKVLFSGNTTVTIVQTTTTWQGAGGDDYLNDGTARACIYNGGSATFVYTVQDGNGNPLVSGTIISASVDNGSISGDTSVSIPDTQTNTNYSVSWTNDITGTDNTPGYLTISVSSENGDVVTTVGRTLIRPVAVSISPSAPAEGDTVTVIPTGGSETVDNTGTTGGQGGYTIRHPNGAGGTTTSACSYGSTITYTAGAEGDGEIVTATDDATGDYAEKTYTVAAP